MTASGSDGNYELSFVDGAMVINPAPLVITAVTHTKSFDGNTSALAVPTVSGLKGADTVSNLSEVYADANPGNGKTLLVQESYRIEDGRSGANYAVRLEPDLSGVIRSLPSRWPAALQPAPQAVPPAVPPAAFQAVLLAVHRPALARASASTPSAKPARRRQAWWRCWCPAALQPQAPAW